MRCDLQADTIRSQLSLRYMSTVSTSGLCWKNISVLQEKNTDMPCADCEDRKLFGREGVHILDCWKF